MDYVTVLLVDDDVDLLRLLQLRLERDGYDVIAVGGGRQALIALERRLPDLAILDILMPEVDGFELAEQIKRRADLPIIFLTSVGDMETRIEGIRRFAEDYVNKPFEYEELLARMQRVLRRTAGVSPIRKPLVFVDDGLSLDFGTSKAHTSRGVVSLSVTEAKLLYHLVRNAGQTLPVGTLVAKIWGYADETGPDALRVAIFRLRRKIEPIPSKPRYVITEREVGYRFIDLKEN